MTCAASASSVSGTSDEATSKATAHERNFLRARQGSGPERTARDCQRQTLETSPPSCVSPLPVLERGDFQGFPHEGVPLITAWLQVRVDRSCRKAARWTFAGRAISVPRRSRGGSN